MLIGTFCKFIQEDETGYEFERSIGLSRELDTKSIDVQPSESYTRTMDLSVTFKKFFQFDCDGYLASSIVVTCQRSVIFYRNFLNYLAYFCVPTQEGKQANSLSELQLHSHRTIVISLHLPSTHFLDQKW